MSAEEYIKLSGAGGFASTLSGRGFATTLGAHDSSWITNAVGVHDTSVFANAVHAQRYLDGLIPDMQSLIGTSMVDTNWFSDIATAPWINDSTLSRQSILATQAAEMTARIAAPMQSLLRDIPSLTGTSQLLAGLMPQWTPDPSFYEARFASLAASYEIRDADARGLQAIRRVLDDSPRVSDALDSTVEAASSSSGLGLHFDEISRESEVLEDALEAEPQIAQRLQQPLDEALTAARLDRYDVVELGTVAGLWKQGRAHEYTATGLFVGCTVGMLHYAGALMLAEVNPIESIIAGAAAYGYVHSLRRQLPGR